MCVCVLYSLEESSPEFMEISGGGETGHTVIAERLRINTHFFFLFPAALSPHLLIASKRICTHHAPQTPIDFMIHVSHIISSSHIYNRIKYLDNILSNNPHIHTPPPPFGMFKPLPCERTGAHHAEGVITRARIDGVDNSLQRLCRATFIYTNTHTQKHARTAHLTLYLYTPAQQCSWW